MRLAADENRNVRTTNRSESAFRTWLSLVPNSCLMKSPRVLPFQSAICMLRESSTRTPRKFCCETAALITSTGRNRQKRSKVSVTTRRVARTNLWRVVLCRPRAARYVSTVTMTASDDEQSGRVGPRGGQEAELPLLKDSGPVAEQQSERRIQQS